MIVTTTTHHHQAKDAAHHRPPLSPTRSEVTVCSFGSGTTTVGLHSVRSSASSACCSSSCTGIEAYMNLPPSSEEPTSPTSTMDVRLILLLDDETEQEEKYNHGSDSSCCEKRVIFRHKDLSRSSSVTSCWSVSTMDDDDFYHLSFDSMGVNSEEDELVGLGFLDDGSSR